MSEMHYLIIKLLKIGSIDFAYAKWGSVLNQDIEQADFVFKQPIELLSLIKS